MAPPFSPGIGGMRATMIHSTSAANGTLMKKTARHESHCTSAPPRSGPAMMETAVSDDHVPIAFPRSFAGKTAVMMDKLPGTSSAAPRPCTPRATMSCRTPGAKPHQIEAAAKTATPVPNTRTRPRRSPSEPPARMSAERTSR